jgi:DmsE family decaheme c-type cytochrome
MSGRPTYPHGIGLVLSLLYVMALAWPVMADGKPGNAGPAGSAEPATQYAGVDTCRTCHEEVYKGFERTAHFQTTKEGHGCEACHGPGAEHVAGGGDVSKIVRFSKLSRAEANGRCLSCHSKRQEQAHFPASAHAGGDVGCLDCHSPHHARQAEGMLVKAQPQLCYGCHQAAKADFGKPYHHRVNEGLVQCSDCHSAHGAGGVREARSTPTGDAVCFKCHADKQGPFAYEHLPVKTEGCGSCHTPHGSTNPRFLRVSQVNLTCLQCHSFPAAGPSGPAHNQSQKYQACTMCHPAIHGSNADRAFLK